MTNDPERMPVIVGVGQINDRPADPLEGLDPPALMIEALRRAEADAGARLLADVDSLAIVDQISFRALNPLTGAVAAGIGAAPRLLEQSPAPHGDTPIRFLNEAANAIAAGEIRLAAVTGAEALRTAAARARAADTSYAAIRNAGSIRAPTYAQRHGLAAPVDVYPLYENATRAAWGQTLEQGQAESAELWSGMSQVAARESSGAWIRKPVSAAEVLDVSAANRPIAFPYSKLMVANSSVNQGAGFIVASLAEARRRRVSEDKLIHIGAGAAAKEPTDILARDRFDYSVSMDTAIRRTLALNGLGPDDFDVAELYSCFPCVPKMARRVLGWDEARAITVFGGLTFGGGPIANYMSHAVCAMVERLRGAGERGFLFANGGFATDNHCIVLGREAVRGASLPASYDYQAEADAARGAIPALDEDYRGAATIETYTVFYDREGAPRGGVVVARTPDAARTLAAVDPADEALIPFLTDGASEPVGTMGTIAGEGRHWRA